MSLPIYSSTTTAKWDAFTMQHEPISSIELMERAASLATKQILGNHLFESAAIICGPGNNGGDGLVIARLLCETQKTVSVYYWESKIQSADFKKNFEKLPKGLSLIKIDDSFDLKSFESELVIDCIFGSGLNRPLEGWLTNVVGAINHSTGKIISIDIPSGLFAQGANNSNDSIVNADLTLTFMSPKMTFFFPENKEFVGDFKVLDIQLHQDFVAEPIAHFLNGDDIRINRRGQFDHKGISGYLTLIAGLGQMTGAAVLSARSAMKSGAGYVDLISSTEAKQALMVSQAEVICQSSEDYNISAKTNALAIGPGLGTTENSKNILLDSFQLDIPIVIDADALTILSTDASVLEKLPKNAILTPHLGELRKLIGPSENSDEMLTKQIEFSKSHEIFIIQKGAYSKLTTPEGTVFVNSTGNAGMASAGMGDVLTGLIGSLLAQGYSTEEASKFGMFLHGYAADKHVFHLGEIGLVASDIVDRLPKTMNDFSY